MPFQVVFETLRGVSSTRGRLAAEEGLQRGRDEDGGTVDRRQARKLHQRSRVVEQPGDFDQEGAWIVSASNGRLILLKRIKISCD